MTAGRHSISCTKEWGTPQKYVDAIRKFFNNKIDLDPCSNRFSIVKAGTEFILPEHDGLIESWNYNNIYVNPPYGTDKNRGTHIRDWLNKCVNAHIEHNSEVLALVPVATNTKHWKKCVWEQATAVAFLYDTRLKFLIDGKDTGTGAPMACAIVYWGKDYRKFYDIFTEYGSVLKIK